VKGELHHEQAEIKIVAGKGLGYIVPNYLQPSNLEDKLTLNFRVVTPYSDKKLIVKLNGTIIKSVFRPHMLPAEMETMDIPKDLITVSSGELSVEVEGA